jgi:hypothetical protein
MKLGTPLMSARASGDFGKLINFHNRPSGAAAAKAHRPGSVVASHAEPSASQSTIRGFYQEAVSRWHDLTSEEKALWNAFVEGS